MASVLYIILLTLASVNIIVHCIGFHLLLCLHNNSNNNVQQTYIINLSVVEIFGNALWFTCDLINLIESSTVSLPILTAVYKYIEYVVCTMFLLVYYMSMVFIAVDRFLQILLNIKYPLYWNNANAKYLIKATWLLGCFFCISLITACNIGGFKYQLPFVKYVYPTFDFVLIIIVVACYAYIIQQYTKIQKNAQYGSDSNHQRGLIKIFRKSRFYISFLLVLTFVVFVIIPDLTYLLSVIESKQEVVDSPSGVLLVLYHFSFLSDACIYVFLQPEVRRIIRKKLSTVRSCWNPPTKRKQYPTRHHDDSNRESAGFYLSHITESTL